MREHTGKEIHWSVMIITRFTKAIHILGYMDKWPYWVHNGRQNRSSNILMIKVSITDRPFFVIAGERVEGIPTFCYLVTFQSFDHSSWPIRCTHHLSPSYNELLLFGDPGLSSINLNKLYIFWNVMAESKSQEVSNFKHFIWLI